MADKEERQEHPGNEGARQGDGLDRTSAFDPLAGDHPEGGPAERPGRDETSRLAGPAETTRLASGGAVPADRTAQLPPGGPGPRPGEPQTWSGRASVPPPRAPTRESIPAEWSPDEEPPGRTWWLPILIGVMALLLLAILLYGLWLIANSRDEEAPVTPSPSPVPSAVSTPAARTPTSAAPTSESPAPSPTTAESVEVPDVVDLPQPVAEALLDRFGLRHRVEHQQSDRPAGTVLESNPGPGEKVAPGSQVTLIVAEPRDEPPTTPPATSAP
jgi:hypothetical protein